MTDLNQLKRSLSFRDVIILAFSTMIGWGWVSLSGGVIMEFVLSIGIGIWLVFSALFYGYMVRRGYKE